jgi:ABC-type Fe3+/spermidine/putrescine transport system ATPase subunit
VATADRTSPNNILELQSVGKQFAGVVAVSEFSLSVKEGEIIALLGPSGCGKTTTLRMIAGLEDPSEGEITYDGRIVASAKTNSFVPPDKRNMGMVFQSYALWPHMTVFENVAHPLKLRRRSRSEIREKVSEILAVVGMSGYEDRPVPKLSGGQQQRIALARAIVYQPRVLLLDEPFSNLDAQLRTQMRHEIRTIQRRLGMTTIFVTHDQVEALSVADRIAVLHDGRLMQIGTPRQVYRNPASKTVRDFLGRVISFPGRIHGTTDGEAIVAVEGIDINNMVVKTDHDCPAAGTSIEISIRPEDIIVEAIASGDQHDVENRVRACIKTLLFLGDHWEAVIDIGQVSVMLNLPHTRSWEESQPVYLVFPAASLRMWQDSSNSETAL